MNTTTEAPESITKTANPTVRRELGALWSRQGSSGTYYTGKFRLKDIKNDFDEVKIIVFQNNKKKSDGSPDLQIFMEKSQYESIAGVPPIEQGFDAPAKKSFNDSTTKAALTEVSQNTADANANDELI